MNSTTTSHVLDVHPNRFNQIKSGVKKATLREGLLVCRLGPATIVNSETKEEIPVRIKYVEACQLNEVSPDMLKSQNYSSLAELISTMKSLYPGLKDTSTVTHVEFEVMK